MSVFQNYAGNTVRLSLFKLLMYNIVCFCPYTARRLTGCYIGVAARGSLRVEGVSSGVHRPYNFKSGR